jgi:hypothetical protein
LFRGSSEVTGEVGCDERRVKKRERESRTNREAGTGREKKRREESDRR